MLELHLHDVGRDGGELRQQGWREHVFLALFGPLRSTDASTAHMTAEHIHWRHVVRAAVVIENHGRLVPVLPQVQLQ